MTFANESISEVSFVTLAMQTQQQINDAYMRKMNRDYAAYLSPSHIPNPHTASITTIPIATTFNGSTNIEPEPS